MPVLKLYGKLLLGRVAPFLGPLLSPWNVGCRKGFQALELISAVRWTVGRSREWALPLYCIKLDFLKAFGSLARPALEKTLSDAGVPRDHIDAVLRELLGVELHLKYGDVVSDRVLSLIGVPQGDPGSPLYFASTIDRLLRPLLSRWKAAEVGLTLSSDDVEGPGVHMPLLAWMDDLYVFCTSEEDATSTYGPRHQQRMRAGGADPAAGKVHVGRYCPWLHRCDIRSGASHEAGESGGGPRGARHLGILLRRS